MQSVPTHQFGKTSFISMIERHQAQWYT